VGEQTGAQVSAIQVKVAALSDMGRVRKNNEDNFVVCNLSSGEVGLAPSVAKHELGTHGTLFMVADGMGGEASGEVASQIATATIPKRIYENLKTVQSLNESIYVLLIREAIEYANQIIFQKASASSVHKGMGTTTTAATLYGQHLFVADIGAELPADPEKDSRKSILTQAVGSSEKLDVKVTYTKVRQGDCILLCSDGLYNMVSAAEMTSIFENEGGLPARCKALVAKANEHGGTDNITVIIAEFAGAGLAPQDASAPVEVKEFREDDFKSGS